MEAKLNKSNDILLSEWVESLTVDLNFVKENRILIERLAAYNFNVTLPSEAR